MTDATTITTAANRITFSMWHPLARWRERNSLDYPDYDDRAYDSIIPLQRYWQRRRFKIITGWTHGKVLDIGCGSSRIIQSLPGAVGMDIAFPKLRYLRRGVCASAFALPFKAGAFDCVINSEVIEHIDYSPALFTEMYRVLKPGGTLILGTPDYSSLLWRVIEPIYGWIIPGGYRHEHITHYTGDVLRWLVQKHNFNLREEAYICRSELILRCGRG